MARFLIGLIFGIVIGALAVGSEPALPDRLRAGLAQATTLLARATERAAEAVDRAAGRFADRAERTGQGSPREETATPAPSPTPR
jgi:hypothetical protein